MAKRERPRVNRAHRVESGNQSQALEAAQQILWDNLPAIIEKSVELALAGNAQVHVAILRITEKMMMEDKPRRGSSIMEEVRRIRAAAAQETAEQEDDGQTGQSTDMDPEGGDGSDDPDAPGEAGRMVEDQHTPSPDI